MKKTKSWPWVIAFFVALISWVIFTKVIVKPVPPPVKHVWLDTATFLDYKVSDTLDPDSGGMRTPVHLTKEIILRDSTKIVANARTVLRYWLDRSDVRHIQGQGEYYVSIPVGGKKVIVENADLGKITIHPGSKLNICNYEGDGFWRVAAIKGDVEVLRNEKHYVIHEGEDLTYDRYEKKGLELVQNKSPFSADAWLIYSPQMKNYPLRVILNSLERCYGVTIKSSDSVLNGDHFTISWMYSQGPDKILQFLADTGNLTFKWIAEKQYVVRPVKDKKRI